ncbi:MAG: hypothetical protein ABIW76_04185, partial [Fibrobacteria bacterium]
MDIIMPVIRLAANFQSRVSLAFCVTLFWACGKQAEKTGVETSKPQAPFDSRVGVGDHPADSTAIPPSPDAETGLDSVPLPAIPAATPSSPRFSSRPALKGYPGQPWKYRPTLSPPVPFSLRLLRIPDSTMREEQGTVFWTPARAGR